MMFTLKATIIWAAIKCYCAFAGDICCVYAASELKIIATLSILKLIYGATSNLNAFEANHFMGI